MDGTKKSLITLERIMKRTGMKVDEVPNDLEKWKEFIKRANQAFSDLDQEFYLLERSMEISSREMMELHEQFDIAQSIARIGYWSYNPIDNKILWSKETYKLFGINQSVPIPTFDELMDVVHENDRETLAELIKQGIQKGIDYELEFRIRHVNGSNYYWVYVKAHAYKRKIKKTEQVDNLYMLSGVIMDIAKRKESEAKVTELNQQLIAMSRQAGMSAVATSILHNIGNILNSSNISVSLIQEILENSEIKSLNRVTKMINENVYNPSYLIDDPKGKLIPKYLTILSEELIGEHDKINKEINNLIKSTNHIKDIVAMQNALGGIAGIKENINVEAVIDYSLQICLASPERYNISIVKDYEEINGVIIDKSKLIQILVNLLANAKESLMGMQNHQQKRITISIKKSKSRDYFIIIVEDNGMGITKARLTNIFSMGFTTKPKGHGFGLHSSAITANELGGNLIAESEGENKGARFTLQLPIHPIQS